MDKKAITVQIIVKAPMAKVWECWNKPEHVTGWAFASDGWEAPAAENDLRVGGKFKVRMQAKDGSAGFDFTGTYTVVRENELIEYTMDDGRKVSVRFDDISDSVKITETFEPEDENSEEMQRSGWQAILDNFKNYVEGKNKKMQKLNFSIEVNAPREKVWKVLWEDATFSDWTSVFAEGSYAVSEWKEGSKVQFLDPKNNAGMSSMIEKLVPNEFMSFKHLAEIKDGKEQPPSSWSGAMENYTLKENNGVTALTVELDAMEEYKAMFEDKLPKALARVKTLAEADNR